MKRILIVGGANGIGLAVATELARRPETERVYILDKSPLDAAYRLDKMESAQFDITSPDLSLLDSYGDIDSLLVTVGFGSLALFDDIPEERIASYFAVNAVGPIRILKHFYGRLLHDRDFHCGVMVSIAGYMSSPFFSLYGATKASLRIFIESVNVELEKSGSTNRILNVSPGKIEGTRFYNEANDLSRTAPLACDIIAAMERKDDLLIPLYDEVYKAVLERYHADFRAEGLHSYDYKVQRMQAAAQVKRQS